MHTASPLDKFFAAFEGTRDARPIAVVRVAFFVGLALHFFPSLLMLDDNYVPAVLRTDEWSHWIHASLDHVPHTTLRVWSIVTMVAIAAAAAGFATRYAAILAFAGCYTFASFNGLPVQTLALVDAWGILLAWSICGGGAEAWSVDALLRRRAGAPADPVAPKLLSSLVLYQALLAVFFSGVEKVLAGWPWTNEMGVVLSYPKGFMARDWVVASAAMRSPAVTHALSWLTLAVELGCPPLLVLGGRRARLVALCAYEAFFLGIVAMLEVPPLFYFMFASAGLLALRDADVARLSALAARAASPRRPRPAA